jgi:ABC-2 type transport system permease protein
MVGRVEIAPPLRARLAVVLASTRMRLLTISRYKGQLLLDVFIPIVLASMPILMGRAIGGQQAGANFALTAGTPNYVAYMLIGSSVFAIISYAFWHVGYWLRWEQETGTLEAIYLAPTERVWLVAGTALYSMIRSLVSALTAYFLGSWLFGVNPLNGSLLLAFLFILMGLIPVFGLTLFFGALILQVKEANALINLMQWGVTLLMGIYFPVVMLPPLLRWLALAFPPTWMLNGVRSALLGVGFFLGTWYRDLAVLWAFTLFTPLLGYWTLLQVERRVRANEGVGQF